MLFSWCGHILGRRGEAVFRFPVNLGFLYHSSYRIMIRNPDLVAVLFLWTETWAIPMLRKTRTHKRIVAIASKRFRETGLAGFGIAELTIDDDLNEAHRDNPCTGCAFSALAPEIARSDQRTRALTSEQVRNDIQLIAALHPAKDARPATSRAILTFSALVGAMALARAVSDEALSRDILNTVAKLLTDSA
jgi:TetR/AcrR family transcriptional regulator, transcriptional repressor for nem operon